MQSACLDSWANAFFFASFCPPSSPLPRVAQGIEDVLSRRQLERNLHYTASTVADAMTRPPLLTIGPARLYYEAVRLFLTYQARAIPLRVLLPLLLAFLAADSPLRLGGVQIDRGWAGRPDRSAARIKQERTQRLQQQSRSSHPPLPRSLSQCHFLRPFSQQPLFTYLPYSAACLAALLSCAQLHTLPVVREEDGKLMGVLSRLDILRQIQASAAAL